MSALLSASDAGTSSPALSNNALVSLYRHTAGMCFVLGSSWVAFTFHRAAKSWSLMLVSRWTLEVIALDTCSFCAATTFDGTAGTLRGRSAIEGAMF